MWNRFYMKNVVLRIEERESVSRFLPLEKKLAQENISVHTSGYAEEALYITDCRETALALKAENLPVLGFQREGESLQEVDYVMEMPEELEVAYLDRVYRRYRGISWDILETERCIIRESVVEDVETFYQIYENPEITRYMEALYEEPEQERTYMQEYIEKIYKYFEFGIWTVIWKETGEIIGRAGFAVREGYDLPELGFVIGVPWQGKGVAFEICSAILSYGREELGFEQVQALVMPDNKVSLALCHKLGFVEEKLVQDKGQEYQFMLYNLFKP